MRFVATAAALICLNGLALPAAAQELDLTHGGPIDITATDGLEWRQNEQQVIARGDARAIRGGVTVNADRLTAWYRKKAGTNTAKTTPANAGSAADPSSEGNEIYRLQADGHVHIFTATDQGQGDKAVYDLDQSVLVMTGHNLKLSTPNNVITARDDLEYWPRQHMAVARGDAVVVTTGRETGRGRHAGRLYHRQLGSGQRRGGSQDWVQHDLGDNGRCQAFR